MKINWLNLFIFFACIFLLELGFKISQINQNYQLVIIILFGAFFPLKLFQFKD